jgi:hypothetical protein
VLCQFSFRNFKSYREETTFGFQASAIPEFANSLIRREKCSSLLPVGVVYGPNGGGKTNLLQALACLVSTVVEPVHALKKNRNPLIIQQRIAADPFLYDSVSRNEPTQFGIVFRTGEYEYRYKLALLGEEVFREALDRKKIGGKKPAHIFYREGEGIRLGLMLRKEGVNTCVNAKMPFLSFLAINYNLPVIVQAQEWFESCILYSGAGQDRKAQSVTVGSAKWKGKALALLKDMGITVRDYRYEEGQFCLKRQIGEKEYEISMARESDGIQKLLAILPPFLAALEEGRLVVMDELDTKLHPKVLKYLVSMFKDTKSNPYGAQLLFTSHDMATMKNTVFRRDEIWFAALDGKHSSRIYSLYEIRREDNERVNSTAAFDKQYLEGKFGADPDVANRLCAGAMYRTAR